MKYVIISLAVFFLILYASVKITRKLLKIEKLPKSEVPKKANYLERIGQGIIGLSFTLYTINIDSKSNFITSIIVFGILTMMFDAFVKWRYMNESREYIISIVQGVVVISSALTILPFILDKFL